MKSKLSSQCVKKCRTALWGASNVAANWVALPVLLRHFTEFTVVCIGLSTTIVSLLLYTFSRDKFVVMFVVNFVSGFNILSGVCING